MSIQRSKQTQAAGVEQTPAQRRFAEQHDAEERALRQQLCNALQFWRVCERRPCGRARNCRGDANDCWHRHWRSFSEEERNWFRALLKALIQGMPAADAIKHADAQEARWAEACEARFDAGGARGVGDETRRRD